MARIIWSPEAVANLEEICKYIAEDYEHLPDYLPKKFGIWLKLFTAFPLAGRMVPEYQRQDLRERIFHGYRIVYLLKPEAVEIVAIVHGARLLPEIC